LGTAAGLFRRRRIAMLEALVIILVVLLLLAGLAGAFIPVLPSSPLILVGAAVYAWFTDFEEVTWVVLAILLFLTLLAQFLEYLATVYGARKMNASKWGMAGAFTGTLVGLFFGIVGVVVGPFIGAFLAELLVEKKSTEESFKSGLGAFIGFLGGALGKLIIALIMCGVFIASLF
jgi:uncharacterized protein YqgC (DUF456 family)